MSVDYKVRQIYNDIIHEVTKNAENWKDVLSLTGRIYRYEFDNILMIYGSKLSASFRQNQLQCGDFHFSCRTYDASGECLQWYSGQDHIS